MNKLLTILFLSAFLSCSSEVVEDDAQPVDIEFLLSTVLYRTRTDLVNSYLDVDELTLYAYAQSSAVPLLDDLRVWRERRVWCYDGPLFWGDYNSEPSTFFAYSPYPSADNGLIVSSSCDSLVVDYQAPSDVALQPYLLVSFPVECDALCVDPICFIMQHPLCAVSFSVEDGAPEPLSIRLVGVGVNSQMTMWCDGSYAWRAPTAFGDVEYRVGEYAMMIPQSLGGSAYVSVSYDDRAAIYPLDGHTWASNERVDYTIATDSIYTPTLHRELNP